MQRFPNQQTIYPEFLPAYVNRVNPETQLDQLNLRLRERNSSLKLVDIRDELISKKSEGILYTKSEGHWNDLGALYGFSKISAELNKIIPAIVKINPNNYSITIGKRDFPPVSFSEDYPEAHVKGGSNFSIQPIKTSNPNETYQLIRSNIEGAPKALFVGDSFLDMGPQFMARSFSEAMVVHHAYSGYAQDVISQYRPDIVVFELVERFLNGAFIDPPKTPILLPPSLSSFGEISRDRCGYVDYVNLTNDSIQLRGWAYDNSFKSSPSKVALYVNGKAVAVVAPSLDRPDIVPKEITIKRAGFDMMIPRAVLSSTTNNHVEIVAFFGPEAHSIRRIEVVPSELAKLPNISK